MESNISLSIDLVDINHEILCRVKLFYAIATWRQPRCRRGSGELPMAVPPVRNTQTADHAKKLLDYLSQID
jgi:hypothetical protein